MKFNSKQEVFDYVARFLIKQGEPSLVNGGCVYRQETGNKKKVLRCAVGCVIPKKVYTKKMEGQNITSLLRGFSSVLPPELAKYEDLFSSLQSAHDNAALDTDYNPSKFLDKIKLNLRDVAASHKLNLKTLR